MKEKLPNKLSAFHCFIKMLILYSIRFVNMLWKLWTFTRFEYE